jgi:hypothetical protein
VATHARLADMGFLVEPDLPVYVEAGLERAIAGLPLQDPERRWFGAALLPQAGVAVGMALVAAREFPEAGEMILTLTIGTTVVFELVGPLATLWAIRRVGGQTPDETARG